MFLLIILLKHVSKKFTYITYFAAKAFFHIDIDFYTLYTVASINQYHLVDYVQRYFENKKSNLFSQLN